MLSVISFPAFAVEDEDLVKESREKIISKLQVLKFTIIVFSNQNKIILINNKIIVY